MILGGSVAWGHARGHPIDPATTRQLVSPIPAAIEALMECCEMTSKNRRMKNTRAERESVPLFLLMLLPPPLLYPHCRDPMRSGSSHRAGKMSANLFFYLLRVKQDERPENLEGGPDPRRRLACRRAACSGRKWLLCGRLRR